MKLQSIKITFLAMIVSAALLIAYQPGFAQQGESADSTSKSKEKAEPLPGLAELVHKAAKLDERYSDLQRRLPRAYNLEKTEEQHATITDKLEKLKERTRKLESTENPNYQDLAELKSSFQAVARDSIDSVDSITESINRVENWRAEWLGEFEQWNKWESAILESVKINTVAATFARARGIIEKALNLISETLEPMLIAQEKAENLRYETYKLTAEVDTLILAVRGDVLGKATPVMFSDYYMWNLRRAWLYELDRGLSISWPEKQFFIDEAWVIALEIILSLLIAISCKRHRRKLQETGKWNFVARRPYSAGLTVAIPILSAFHGPIPALWRLLLWLVAGTALSRLATGITADVWSRRIIYGITALTIFNQLLLAVGLPVPFVRLYVLIVAVGGLLFFGWRMVRNILDKAGTLRRWLIRLAALVFLVILIAEVIGQTVFAWSLLDASTRTILFLLMGWILIKLIRGGLELAVRSPLIKKVPLVAKNATAILRHAMTLIALVIWGFIIANVLVDWRIFNIPSDAIQGVLSLGFKLGEQKVTLGLMLSALGVLYGAFIISWTIQGVLMEDVFARRGLDRGARISIGRLIHYALVLVGFIFALSALGFDLKNITILGGALGVGIGFGLQTIVNNFVCGLIMLFERPVKVGDSIELNGQNGKIKKVGLRSTVVQTYDNSEIVVPNSDLITNQVTNWTLAERRMRFRLPVGVAYGSDVQLVIDTLLQCAADNDLVLKYPAPKVLFRNFGGSSLDFELRAWVADFDSRLQAISDLHREIDRRFRELKIEIPFPQTDLHLRTIDQPATTALNNGTSKPLPPVSAE